MSNNIEVKIEQALAIMNGEERYFLCDKTHDQYSFIYPFTTENLNSCFGKFNLKNKTVLTVCGSGDHILNTIFSGASTIDAFDINELSFMLYNLKKAGIRALTYDEYLTYFYHPYFSSNNDKYKNSFCISLYWKISPYLDEETRFFFDNLYLESNGLEIRQSDLFGKSGKSLDSIKLMNNYLQNEENYNILKNIINDCKVNFIVTDIKNLREKLTRKYDFIFLSNIAKYIPNMVLTPANREECFKADVSELTKFRELAKILAETLNRYGKIAIAYLFDYHNKFDSPRYAAINRAIIRDIVFDKETYSYVTFPSVDAVSTKIMFGTNVRERDSVLIYRKK